MNHRAFHNANWILGIVLCAVMVGSVHAQIKPLSVLADTDLAPKADAYDYCTRRADQQ